MGQYEDDIDDIGSMIFVASSGDDLNPRGQWRDGNLDFQKDP